MVKLHVFDMGMLLPGPAVEEISHPPPVYEQASDPFIRSASRAN